MSEPRDFADPASYSVRIAGSLGPLFLSSLPHRAVLHTEGRSIVIARMADADLVDIVRKCVEFGVEIESVREIEVNDHD